MQSGQTICSIAEFVSRLAKNLGIAIEHQQTLQGFRVRPAAEDLG
jgi:hypothetical protein